MESSTARIQALRDHGDTTFWADLEHSRPYEAAVRRMHSAGGALTGSYPMQCYPDGQHHDIHDVAVAVPEEVKSRSFNFDSFESLAKAGRNVKGWPYPTVIIDTVHHLDGNLQRFGSWPRCYWIWSKDRGHVLRVDTEQTFRYWVRQWFDVRGRMRKHYVCPMFTAGATGLYTASEILASVDGFRHPCPLMGLEIYTAARLQGIGRDQRSRKDLILRRLQGSQWVDGDELVSDNPGCAAA